MAAGIFIHPLTPFLNQMGCNPWSAVRGAQDIHSLDGTSHTTPSSVTHGSGTGLDTDRVVER